MAEYNTIKVGELPPAPWGMTNLLPKEVAGNLTRGTVQQLADLISDYIGTASSLAFNPTTILDGGTLPDTDSPEWVLVGKGTFYNVNGGATITTTEELNALTSNGTVWDLSVEIPINVELAGIVQSVRSGYTTTAPSEDAVFNAIAQSIPEGTEMLVNKQNSLVPDPSGVKYITANAVINGLDEKQNTLRLYTVGGNQTVSNDWNKNTIVFTTSGTITVPDNLSVSFYFNGITLPGVNLTWVLTGDTTWVSGDPGITTENKRFIFAKKGAEESIIFIADEKGTFINVKDFGAKGDGINDDTTNIQNAINHCFANGGGTVYFPEGVYILLGNLITSLDSVNPNCQLYLPLTTEVNIGNSPVIKLLGESPNFNTSGLIAWPKNSKGSILLSKITGSGTNPSVIGSSYATTTFGPFNYTQLEIENLGIRVKSLSGSTHIIPTVGGINAGNIELFSATNLHIDTESPNYLAVEPTIDISGIIMPYINNNAWSYLNRVSIENFNKGIRVSEHTNGTNVSIWNCVEGLRMESSGHLSSFDHLLLAWCKYNIYVISSPLPVKPTLKVNNLVIEDYNDSLGVKWYANIFDVYDINNQLRGEIKYLKVISNAGMSTKLTVSGAKKLNKYNLFKEGEKNEVVGSQAYTSQTGPGLSGFTDISILEVNSDVSSSSDDGFANLYLTHTQNGNNNLVGRICFINLASTISDKRIAQVYATTNSSKQVGKLYVTVNDGATMQSVIEIDANRIKFQKSLNLKGYTVATLPTGNEGDTAYVTDALSPTYLSTITGGGSVKCPVFYNGVSWVAH